MLWVALENIALDEPLVTHPVGNPVVSPRLLFWRSWNWWMWEWLPTMAGMPGHYPCAGCSRAWAGSHATGGSVHCLSDTLARSGIERQGLLHGCSGYLFVLVTLLQCSSRPSRRWFIWTREQELSDTNDVVLQAFGLLIRELGRLMSSLWCGNRCGWYRRPVLLEKKTQYLWCILLHRAVGVLSDSKKEWDPQPNTGSAGWTPIWRLYHFGCYDHSMFSSLCLFTQSTGSFCFPVDMGIFVLHKRQGSLWRESLEN